MQASLDLTALAAAADTHLPWMPVGPGLASRPLAFLPDGQGWVTLLRVEPGTGIARHRHQGAVHGFILAGRRRLGPNGPVLGPGSFHHEPAGNIDAWTVEGDQPLVSLFIVCGPVDYLDPEGRVLRTDTADGRAEAYRRFCLAQGVAPPTCCAVAAEVQP